MKKKLRIIIILVVLMSLMLLNGCIYEMFDFKNVTSYFETELYMCALGTKNNVIIGGLTELGKAQEELIIPTEINGLRVTSIGARHGNINYWGGGKFTKLFLPEGVQINRADLLASYRYKLIFLSVTPSFDCPTDRRMGGGSMLLHFI